MASGWELVGYDAGVKVLVKLPVDDSWVFHAETGFLKVME